MLRAGYHIHDHVFGTGPLDGLMLHCSLSNLRAWTGIAGHLCDLITAQSFDLPGHGQSQDWDFQGDFQDRAVEIAKTFMDRPRHIIGHSFGGTIALRLAHEMPEMVQSLTLIEPVFFYSATKNSPQLWARYAQDHQDIWDNLARKDFAQATQAFMRAWGDGTPWDRIPQKMRDYFVDRMVLVGEGGNAIHQDPHGLLNDDGLARISCPSLFIRGANSHFMIAPIHHALMEMMTGALEHVVDDAGHMVPVTHPKECANFISEFLQHSI